MTTKTTVSGGFNPPHYQKYPGLAAYRMALGLDEEAFEKHVKKLIGQAAVAELGRQEKIEAQRREVAELKRSLALLKRLYPKQYSEVMEAKRLKSLTARPGFAARLK
jgi:hypothetical protein